MATKRQVIELNRRHPEWTARDIAEELDCMIEYVHACKQRYSLRLARGTYRAGHPNNIYTLGRAAKRAGLTVEKIKQLSGAGA